MNGKNHCVCLLVSVWLLALLVCPAFCAEGKNTPVNSAPNQSAAPEEKDKRDYTPALPTAEEWPEFTVRLRQGKGPEAFLNGIRKSDGAHASLIVYVFESPEKAQVAVASQRLTESGQMSPGCPSNTKVGEEIYETRLSRDSVHRLSYGLLARDGCSYVNVHLSYRNHPDKDHRPPIIRNEDKEWCEKMVVKALAKLTEMGHTSKSKTQPAEVKATPKPDVKTSQRLQEKPTR